MGIGWLRLLAKLLSFRQITLLCLPNIRSTMQTFSSKIGLEIAIPLTVLLGGLSLLMISENAWGGVAVLLAVIAFIVYLFTNTYYQIDGQVLRVRAGFLINQSIAIEHITKITETRNPISSPANSLDRLDIAYNRYDSVLVSPKDKEGFIAALQAINPAIEVKWRKQ